MPESPWSPPHEFDDLELIRPLGSGGMGAVHLAREARLDRLVAVKFVVPAGPSQDPMAIERFRLEARALARLQHPNIVAIYRIGEVDGHPYLAYEFVDGERLDQLRRPMAWPQVLAIVLGIARGLAAAHARGVLHRDLKPANLMITPDGRAKILDFGLARIFDPSRGPAEDELVLGPLVDPAQLAGLDSALTWDARVDRPSPSGRLTEVGSLVGTPLYLAPELWNGAPATQRADLYALGLIAYELLLGRHPREPLEGIELARRVQRHDLPRLSEELPSAPRPLTELIDRCVAREPEHRPGSAREVRDQLELLRAVYRPFLGGEIDDGADEVARSFARVAPRGLELAESFYARWFATAPEVRPMFAGVAAVQPRMLAAALKLAVENLREPQRLIPVLEDLGRRHGHHGLRAEHFTSMGEALLATLGDLDPEWTEVTRRGWTVAWNGITQVMRRALAQAEAASPASELAPLGWALPPPPPPTRWLQRPGGDLAWQELGHGPIDLIVLGEWVTDVEQLWRHPLVAGFHLRLAEDHRLILFDRRGTGGSARRVRPTVEAHVDDLRDVLDAARSDRAVLVALGDATAAAALFAATHPGRVRGLVVIGGGLLAGGPAIAATAAEIRAGWGHAVRLEALAPSLAADPAYRQWWAALLRGAASPSGAVELYERTAAAAVAPVLPAVRAPTLVLHRAGDRLCPPDAAARLADAIPGARRRELSGADHVPWAGDGDAMLAAIREFVDELPTETHSSTAAAAVLAVVAAAPVPHDRLRELVANEVARHGGAPTDAPPGLIGLELFDAPTRALRCARAVVELAAAHGLAVRVGLDIGPVAIGRSTTGGAVSRAAALAEAAAAGEILATAAMVELVGDSTVASRAPREVAGARAYACAPA